MSEKWQNAISGQNLRFGTDTKSGYQYPWLKAKWCRYHIGGTGTQSQKGVGTGTNQSGTGTDAFGSPDFCIRALISPKFVLR